ncbi:GntP family permease [Luxibacter massiliensis]|uniref:GntP family permease n=1 Tax=Luxibacter massiliensis TaxID=2219695 RepID=UPI000F0599FC|nr:GntP family permease [Luxibacter massiliensis]
MSTTFLIISLIISIALVVLLCTKAKCNPAIALILGSLLLGFLAQVPLVDVTAEDGTVTTGLVNAINNGFGNMMGSIGFPIGLGIILGQFVSDTGGATVIADKLVSVFPNKYAIYAVAFAGFILSIPVFFDVTFVILIPIGVALMKKLNKGIGYIVGAISIGAGIAHTLVPPTPNPLVAPEYFNFDLGIMIAAGLLFGIPMALIATTIHGKLMDRGLWNPEKDENGNGLNVDELELPEKLPGFFISLLPIIIPIVLILLNTVVGAVSDDVPAWIDFLGQKTTSMLCGTLAGMLISIKILGLEKTEKVASDSLKSAGIVFLITGAGGSFSEVITASGVSEAIKDMVSNISGNVALILLIGWILGLLFRQITGSGTVASLTTFAIMQSVATTVAIHPVFIALACLDGALFGATINDSGFWIVSNMSGLNLTGGAKTYTLGQAIASVTGIILIVIVGLISTLFI